MGWPSTLTAELNAGCVAAARFSPACPPALPSLWTRTFRSTSWTVHLCFLKLLLYSSLLLPWLLFAKCISMQDLGHWPSRREQGRLQRVLERGDYSRLQRLQYLKFIEHFLRLLSLLFQKIRVILCTDYVLGAHLSLSFQDKNFVVARRWLWFYGLVLFWTYPDTIWSSDEAECVNFPSHSSFLQSPYQAYNCRSTS